MPAPLKKHLESSDVSTLYELGWSTLENGELIDRAEKESFATFITTDKNLKYQQNIKSRTISIVVLPTTNWQIIQQHVANINHHIRNLSAGEFVEIKF